MPQQSELPCSLPRRHFPLSHTYSWNKFFRSSLRSFCIPCVSIAIIAKVSSSPQLCNPKAGSEVPGFQHCGRSAKDEEPLPDPEIETQQSLLLGTSISGPSQEVVVQGPGSKDFTFTILGWEPRPELGLQWFSMVFLSRCLL